MVVRYWYLGWFDRRIYSSCALSHKRERVWCFSSHPNHQRYSQAKLQLKELEAQTTRIALIIGIPWKEDWRVERVGVMW